MRKLNFIASQALEARYYKRDKTGSVTEGPTQLWQRVSTAIAGAEHPMRRQYWGKRFFARLANHDFMPNSPTLMNAGTEEGQLSACFVLPVPDSINGIYETLKNAAIIHKSGGGTGFGFSRVRPSGAMVDSCAGVATGPCSFCLVYDTSTHVVKQGKRRRGANMMILRVDHPDILEFIDMKMTPGVMTNFNVSVAITDAFMEALKEDDEYELHHPTIGTTGMLRARYVWDKIANNAWKSAEPGIVFIDRINERSPYWETIEATNPCGEQPLPAFGSCNLGSINVSNFASSKGFDWESLAECVTDCVRFLDNVIDVNNYPIPEIEEHTKRYRNIGLGVMGFANALIKMKVAYNSDEGVEMGNKLQEFINAVGHTYSIKLGKEKGVPAGAPFKYTFHYSDPYRRNATVTTQAPTGSISMLCNEIYKTYEGPIPGGVEPNFAFETIRHQLDREMVDLHPLYAAAKNNGGVDKRIFVDSHDISPEWHVKMQAAFQQNCDSAISKTINLPKTATVEDVESAYMIAYDLGCKGVTVYRDGSREGVLHRKDEPKTTFENYCTECGGEVIQEEGCEKCTSCGLSKCLIA